ncbi:MAG: protein kinase domain-containing protein [bacterium]
MSDTNPDRESMPPAGSGPDAEAIFHHARTLPVAERSAYVAAACAGHPAVRAAIEQLLAAVENAGGFLASQGPARAEGGEDAAASAASAPAPTAGFTTAPGRITERPGVVIGPYKLLQLIGEGGFGTVFLAEQTAPVRRRVALKIIKLGMDTRQVVARFEAERQALAMMDHPHIARVLDGGATPAFEGGGGRPYFVMEYVVGDAITTFADAHALNIAQRLDLFGQVCSAVQHAHTKGIIHRDLKPGNVLVSMVDDKPFAKVIDFGIAKATGGGGAGHLTDKTLFTEHRQLIGTPEYMSPEQAEGSQDIDTRTDVYALGVLLYELLTGSTPIESARLRSAAYGEMQRIIREEEPLAPSMKLSRSLEKLAGTAAARRAEPGKLSALVRGELDWIVLKALEKERARRYETASALAEDVKRHLAGEPVVAAPVSRAYRVRKFVRRNRGAVGAGAAIAATLVVGIAGTTWGLLAAERQALVAGQNAARALLAQDDAEWSAYAANLALAQAAMGTGNYPEARKRLSEAPERKRGWEAEFLDRASVSIVVMVPGYWTGAQLSPAGVLTVENIEFGPPETRSRSLTLAAEQVFSFTESSGLSSEQHSGWLPVAMSSSSIAEAVGDRYRFDSQYFLSQLGNQAIALAWRNRHVRLFDVRSQVPMLEMPGVMFGGLSLSADGRWLLVHAHGVVSYERDHVSVIDVHKGWSPESEWRDQVRLRTAAILASSPNGPSGLTITTPDGTRRIVGASDMTVRFYEAKDGKPTLPATAEHPGGVYREVAVFRTPAPVTNLQMTGDGTRLIIHLEGGSARVWDIRDPEERRKDLQAEWAERVPAGAYLDTLWAGDTADDKLQETVINDASLTPLRRLVAAEMLEERLGDDRIAAERAFEQMKQAAVPDGATPAADPASITNAVRAAAAAAELPKRVKARVMALAAGWEYKRPEPSDADRLAAETKQRRLAEADLALASIRNVGDDAFFVQQSVRLLQAFRTRLELLGPQHELTVSALRQTCLNAGWTSGLTAIEQFLAAAKSGSVNVHPTVFAHLVLIRSRVATDDPTTFAAYAEIDGKPGSLTGGTVLDREGHRAAAREALAKARALMAPAADGTPSPWANDQDAKALLAEAAALIEGAGAAQPATPAKDDR